ncbi:MAG TPA: DUF177 domain-containing protein [Alphaproteobacteria bacterium]|nr:DUF177 domain-containing protein [Alphaproteobacteria bacterium]
MFIKIKDLELRKLEFDEAFKPGVLDIGPDMEQKVPVKTKGRAELIREDRGGRNIVEDIRVVGSFSTRVEVRCARCLEPVSCALDESFDLLYRPIGVDAKEDDASIGRAEAEIGYFEGEGVELAHVVQEQVLLALPVKQVCNAACKGLCVKCGRNLNLESCDCVLDVPDPRWADLESIRKKLER